MHAKITVVVLLAIYSMSLEHYRKKLESGLCQRSGKFFRAYNEVPTILALFIVTFVIVKKVSLLFIGIVLALSVFIVYKIMNNKKEQ